MVMYLSFMKYQHPCSITNCHSEERCGRSVTASDEESLQSAVQMCLRRFE
jgi:hypothetical protein